MLGVRFNKLNSNSSGYVFSGLSHVGRDTPHALICVSPRRTQLAEDEPLVDGGRVRRARPRVPAQHGAGGVRRRGHQRAGGGVRVRPPESTYIAPQQC